MRRSGSSGEQRAQERFGTSARAAAFYAHQTLPHLNQQMQQFIARMDMVFIATADGKGACDCSFRAGEPGFVQVLDEKTLVYPEYRGNGVLASLGNMLENPHIGLIFLDFCQSTVGLHVNGTARVLDPADTERLPHLRARIAEAAHVKGGRHPKAWVLIGVEEAYIHCSKHVPLLKRLDKHIAWGSDDEQAKGGNFFKVTPDPPPGAPDCE
ncbi:MAG: pyridoxamine 5'-phosphate oxidase family protein [Nitrospira sp.]|nr:pyridoxamine 5'-phosphate oxidase family protein [Nitrospira sp.]